MEPKNALHTLPEQYVLPQEPNLNPLRALSSHALSLIRRGENGVIWAGDGKRGGNYLYVWLRADSRLEKGRRTPLLYKENMQDWLDEFPALQELTIAREDVRLTMPRFSEWPIYYGVDFTETELNKFLHRRLLSSQDFATKIAAASNAIDPHQLTINIRRGDYYSTQFEKIYGINIESYVAEAITLFDDVTSIRVISDDLDWCKNHLAMFPKNLPIHFGGVTPGAFGDLAALASSAKLILPNSTFSYWGGFLSDLLTEKNNKLVVPEIHERYDGESRKWPLPDRWLRLTTASSLASAASPD